MSHNPSSHRRRSIRLGGYDYSQPGAYFVTVCTYGRRCLFGEVVAGAVRPNGLGKAVTRCWLELTSHYEGIQLDAFVVMPNHVHGVIIKQDIVACAGAGLRPAPTRVRDWPLSEAVRAFKSFSARRINALRNRPGAPLWQRNYYEHVIRNEADLREVREYLAGNPLRWELDELYPGQVIG